MRYNYSLTTLDTSVLEIPLRRLLATQKKAFKIDLSYGFILRNKHTGRHMYYHSSCNCCGRYLEEPRLITNRDEFDAFLKASNKATSCSGPSLRDRIRRGVRTRDERHFLRQSHYRAPNILRQRDTPLQREA